MGIFGKKKKKEENKEEDKTIQQDLNKDDPTARPGGVFMVHLLMKEKCEAPDKKQLLSIMEKHLGEIECISFDEQFVGMAAKRYSAKFKDGVAVPPQLMVMPCAEFDENIIDDFRRSQFWRHKDDYRQILSRCPYSVMATDMLAGGLSAKERAEFDMDFVEALVDLYPECEAVYFLNSGTLFLAEEIRHHDIPKKNRFIYFAMNVRLFNIQGSESKIVDTLGLSLLRLPDLQYHFQVQPSGEGTMEMDVNWVVDHAYNTAAYLLEYDNAADDGEFFIKDGETIGGIRDGEIVWDIFWKCHYEDAMIQPMRLVLDICMNEYAAGNRNYIEE